MNRKKNAELATAKKMAKEELELVKEERDEAQLDNMIAARCYNLLAGKENNMNYGVIERHAGEQKKRKYEVAVFAETEVIRAEMLYEYARLAERAFAEYEQGKL